MDISVTILTKNSAAFISEVLSSLQDFDEVLLYDNGSTDETLTLAKAYANVKIIEGEFFGFGKTHNLASSLAKHPWILSIDSDEIVSPSLCEEIRALTLDEQTVYSFPRKNYFNGKWIRWCGWHPDRQYRLYHRGATSFSAAEVHEAIITEGMNHHPLHSAIIHYSYSSIHEFLAKMQSYSDLFAKQNAGKKNSSPCKALLHGFYAFFKSYLLKRGFLGGYEGLVISFYNGHTAYYKYLKLYEANLKLDHESRKDHVSDKV